MTNHEATTTPAALAEHQNADGWYLVIDAPVSARRDVGGSIAPAAKEAAPWFHRALLGLPVVLRLALTAQAAGARAIVLSPSVERTALKSALADDRLKIAVRDADEPALGDARARAMSIRIPANVVVHRAALTLLGTTAARSTADKAGHDVPPYATEELTFVPGTSEKSALWRSAREAAGPYGFEPIAVTSRAAFRAAERALLRSLRKREDGWTSTHLNRPISLAITRRLVATALRPNQVSVAILAVGLLGAFLASRGTYASLLAGATLFHAQSVLDGCDGEMSRLTFRGSHTGEWLDTLGDDITNYGFFGAAAFGLYTSTGRTLYLALGGITLFCGFVGSGLEYRYLVKIGSGDLLKYPLGIGKAPGSATDAGPKSTLARMFDAVAPLFKRDTFVFLTLLGAVAGEVGPLLAIFALGAMGVLVAVMKAEFRMAGERISKAARAGADAAERAK